MKSRTFLSGTGGDQNRTESRGKIHDQMDTIPNRCCCRPASPLALTPRLTTATATDSVSMYIGVRPNMQIIE